MQKCAITYAIAYHNTAVYVGNERVHEGPGIAREDFIHHLPPGTEKIDSTLMFFYKDKMDWPKTLDELIAIANSKQVESLTSYFGELDVDKAGQ